MKKKGETKQKITKKGLSPMVAGILLLALVLVLSVLVFTWTRGFLTEQIEKFGQPIDSLCSQVQFEVDIVNNGFGEGILEVVNKGNINIYSLDVRKHFEGETEQTTFQYSVSSGKSTSGDIYLNLNDGSVPEKIEVFAALVGNSGTKKKLFTCTDNGITLTL